MTDKNFHLEAKKLHGSHHLPVVTAVDGAVKVSIGKNAVMNIKANQANVRHVRESVLTLHPQGSVNSDAIANEGYTEFELNSRPDGIVSKLILNYSVKNVNGAGATLGLNSAFLIDRVEIRNSQNKIIQSKDGIDLLWMDMHRTDEMRTKMEVPTGLDGNWDTSVSALADGSTYEFNMPIETMFPTSARLYLGALTEDLYFRVYWSTNGIATANVSSDVSLQSNVTLDILYSEIAPHDIVMLTKQYRNGHFVRFLDTQVQSFNQNAVANDEYTDELTSKKHLTAFMVVTAQDADATGGADHYENAGSPDSIVQIDFEDPKGKNVSITKSDRYMRYIEAPHYTGSSLFQKKNVYLIPFADTVSGPLVRGENSGYMPLNGHYRLKWTASASKNIRLRVASYEYRFVFIKNGRISLRN